MNQNIRVFFQDVPCELYSLSCIIPTKLQNTVDLQYVSPDLQSSQHC